MRPLLFPVLLTTVACSTVVPLQTASTLPKNGYRLAGQGSAGIWLGAPPATTRLPEFRFNARYGVSEGFDLGVSLLGSGEVGSNRPSYRLGLYVDGKGELWSRTLSAGRRQILSVAPGIGYHSQEFPGTVAGVANLELALPLLFGHQSEGFEWIVGAGVIERLQFADLDSETGARALSPQTHLLVLAGLLWRGKVRPGLQLSYQAPVLSPVAATINLSFALLFDLLPQTSEATPAPQPHR